MAYFSTAATSAAKKGTEELRKQMLDILNTNYANQQEVAKNETNTLLNQLTNQANQYQATYQKDAEQNYINKMLNRGAVEDQLKRLGLYNSGYGVSQLGAVDANAATNLTLLKEALGDKLSNIDLQRNEAQTNLANTLLGLESDYNEQQLANEKYLTNLYNSLYADEYNRLFNEAEQQEAIRQFNENLAEKKRQYNENLAEDKRQYNLNLAERKRQADLDESYRNQQIALQKQKYQDELAQALGYISNSDKQSKETTYNNLLSTINKSYGFATEDSLADKYEELSLLIEAGNISGDQKEKLKKALDAAAKKWSINKTSVKGTSSTPSLPTYNGLNMTPFTTYTPISGKNTNPLFKFSPIR